MIAATLPGMPLIIVFTDFMAYRPLPDGLH